MSDTVADTAADALERRLIRLVVPDHDHRCLIVESSGGLPELEFVVPSGETTVLAVARDLLPALGLDLAIVDCYLDQSGEVPIPVLVELESLRTEPPLPQPDWAWRDLHQSYVVQPGLQALLDDRLGAWRGDHLPDPLRPAWGEAGWLREVSAWIADELRAAGRPAPAAITQFRLWGISTVIRVDHDDDAVPQRSWFKAVCPYFGHEPALTRLLHDQLGDRVASVIAIDPDRHWMLLDDLGEAEVLDDPHQHRRAFDHIVAIQRWSSDRISTLAQQGVPRRPLDELHAEFVDVMNDPVCTELLGIDAARATRVADWVGAAIERVQLLDLPDVLVHGDFHPGNIAGGNGRHVVFDWSDAAIAVPFVDVVTWTWWLADNPEAADAVWESFAHAWNGAAWIDAVIANRDDVQAVAGAYHSVSYAGIVRNLDRYRRPEHAYGFGHFFGLVTSAVDAATRTDPD